MRIWSTGWVLLCLVSGLARAAGVTLGEFQQDGRTLYRLANDRVTLVVDPGKGGGVVSCRDALAGGVDVVPAQAPRGLCLDHFQEQLWPGEMLDAAYEVAGRQSTPAEATLALRYTVSGTWQGVENEKLKGLLLEKTYTLRADSPALGCRIRISAPPKEAKLFSYWQQHIVFAGGTFERKTDRTFRPTARGVRVKASEDWGHTGMEDFLRDLTAGWMAVLDTQLKTGLVILSDYNELDALYCSGGNVTLEPMYRITYLPAGKSVEYQSYVLPVVGLENLVTANEAYVAGYALAGDGKGAGRVTLSIVRSVAPPAPLTATVEVANVLNPALVAAAGTVTFEPPSDAVQRRELSFAGAGEDPLVLRVTTVAGGDAGAQARASFEEYVNGTYTWGENIQTDMATPVYRGARPAQKLTLSKPSPLRLRNEPGVQIWYAEGLLDDAYGVAAAAHITSMYRDGNSQDRRDRAFVSYSQNWLTRLSSFPYDYDQLLGYDLLVLGGAKAEALGNIGQEMLCDYLTAGGGMLVLGGPMAYGSSRLRGTPLAELWPVVISEKTFDLRPCAAAELTVAAPETPFLEDLDWSSRPRVAYLHRAAVRPWGKVVLTAAGEPFLVVGEVGPNKARVACILGAPMGTMQRGALPFWQWPDWLYLLRQLNWWLMKEDERYNPQY